jgi:hypothetical protein
MRLNARFSILGGPQGGLYLCRLALAPECWQHYHKLISL